jgi:SagB-type dehydrogenase family enzyme
VDCEINSVAGIHWETAHSRQGLSPHSLAFDHYPLPVKSYGQGKTIALEGVADADVRGELPSFLSACLYLSYGVTAMARSRGRAYPLRPVPSAGGLYPCHLYPGILSRNDDETGVYYYDPLNHCLVLLRQSPGQKAPDLKQPDISKASLFFVITAWLYNSAWKYRNRALRYVMLDAGHLTENLMTVGEAVSPRVSYDFDDAGIGQMLGLDLNQEVPLALVSMNWDKSVSELGQVLCQNTAPKCPDTLERPFETEYMATLVLSERICATGQGSAAAAGNAGVWQAAPDRTMDMPWHPLDDSGRVMAGGRPDNGDLTGLITRRRSRRNFIRRPVRPGEQKILMAWVLERAWPSGLTLALACQGWDGLEDGLYSLTPGQGTLDLIMAGNLQPCLARVCLGQSWVGMAGAVFLCLANLDALDRARGMRGYRGAMLAAGRIGQRIYMGAEASSMGCCGIGAMYDREAGELLGLNRSSALLYALAAGPVKKRTDSALS